MRSRLFTTLTVAVLALLWAAPVRGQADEGEGLSNEGAIFLLLPVSAKAVSLGRAMTALPGAESVWWNPAGLGEVRENRVLVFRGEDLSGEATAASVVLARSGLGTVAVAYQLQDIGDQENTDPHGNSLGTFSFRNHLGVLSLATSFWERLNVGVNFKLVQSRTSCRGPCTNFGSGVTATTFAVDAGAQLTEVAGLPLRLGAALAHAGPDFQFENAGQADPLPTRMRLAAAYEVLGHFVDIEELGLWITTELEERWRAPGDPATYIGSEFTAGEGQELHLRAGYVLNSDSQVDGAAVGLGIRYDSFDLSLAKSLAQSTLAGDEQPVHVSLGFVF